LAATAQQKKAANISILLPFCSKQIISNPNHENAELGNLSREYYQGATIALDSFEKMKLSVRVSVFDTENDSNTTVRITQKQLFKESELIIGPVRQGGNKVVSTFAKKNEVYHVSPLMTFSKNKIEHNFWLSANPDLSSYAGILLKHIYSIDPQAAIIVVADKSVIGKSIHEGFKGLVADKKNKITLLEYNSALDLQLYKSSTSNNHIIIATATETSVNKVLRTIKDTSTVKGLHTYGLMQWLDFKNPDYALFMRCNLRLVSPFYVDYKREEVKQFIAAYREKYFTEPSEAAFRGYDQMLLFGNALATQGKKIMEVIGQKKWLGTGSVFLFEKNKNGYYLNNYLFILKLEDYELIPVQ
jgi:ABC-type branched-subunit amino acid transport system substrate-binding protein